MMADPGHSAQKPGLKAGTVMVRIFIPWFLPAYRAGGPVQSVANLVARPLSEHLHFSILTSNRELAGTPLDVLADRWTPFNPRTRVYYAEKTLRGELMGSVDDVVFINGLYSWTFTLLPIFRSPARRKIVSVRGMLHPGALSQKRFKKTCYLLAWRLFGLHKKVAFHASSATESGYIQQVFGKGVQIYVAGNFPRVFAPQAVGEKPRGTLSLVSVALISPMKNILLVLQALNGMDAAIDYHLYGAVKDAVYWEHCEQLIQNLPPNVRVYYHGDVPPDRVAEALATGQVFILPSKSENFGHALYEALTAGKPVITSGGTPWNGLEAARAGFNVAVDDETAIAATIRTFAAMDAPELREWSRGAARYAGAALNLDAIAEQYRVMFGLHHPDELLNLNESCDHVEHE